MEGRSALRQHQSRRRSVTLAAAGSSRQVLPRCPDLQAVRVDASGVLAGNAASMLDEPLLRRHKQLRSTVC